VPVPSHSPPPQPTNVDPAAAAAVRVICVPVARLAEQVPGQLMPPVELVTLPDPVRCVSTLTPCRPTTHSPVVGHDAPSITTGPSASVFVQALFPPVGLVDVSMSPPASTATHSEIDGHETSRW
jgi:hypothetical protein